MHLFGLPAKQFAWDPFVPVALSFIMQLVALLMGKGYLQRKRTELLQSAVPDQEPVQAALRGAQGFSLVGAVYAGLVPVVGALMIALIGAKVSGTLTLSVIYVTIFVVTFALVGLLSGSLIDMFLDFNTDDPGLPLHEKALARLGFSNYGVLYGWIVIVLTALIQIAIAYVGLPDQAAH